MFYTTIGQLFICLIIADFITGVVHWWEQAFGVPSWGWGLGKNIVEPNIDHHRRPGAIGVESTFFSRNYQSWIAAGMFSLGCLAVGYYTDHWVGWMWYATAWLASLGNEVHTWNHRSKKQNPPLVRFLHGTGIFQTKGHHTQHHVPPYDKNFCTLTNFTNTILEVLYFWKSLEWFAENVLRIKVKRLSPERDGF